MRTVSCIPFLSLFLVTLGGVSAESVDLGRGPVPLVIPKDYDEAKPAPLIVLIHGYTSSGAVQDAYWKIGAQADTYGFFFLAPDGTLEDSEDKNRFWNATEACCDFYESNVDDSGYILSLIDEVKDRYSIDANRVFVMGHSNGGFMSHRMAQDHPDTIAAIAALNGAAPLELSGTKPKRPVNILHIHGTEDRLNSYQGGEIRGIRYPGPVETVEKWAEFSGGSTQATTLTKTLDLDKRLEGNETTIKQYLNGSVELWTINGGGHVPAFTDSFSKLIIEWLLAHPKAEQK